MHHHLTCPECGTELECQGRPGLHVEAPAFGTGAPPADVLRGPDGCPHTQWREKSVLPRDLRPAAHFVQRSAGLHESRYLCVLEVLWCADGRRKYHVKLDVPHALRNDYADHFYLHPRTRVVVREIDPELDEIAAVGIALPSSGPTIPADLPEDYVYQVPS